MFWDFTNKNKEAAILDLSAMSKTLYIFDSVIAKVSIPVNISKLNDAAEWYYLKNNKNENLIGVLLSMYYDSKEKPLNQILANEASFIAPNAVNNKNDISYDFIRYNSSNTTNNLFLNVINRTKNISMINESGENNYNTNPNNNNFNNLSVINECQRRNVCNLTNKQNGNLDNTLIYERETIKNTENEDEKSKISPFSCRYENEKINISQINNLNNLNSNNKENNFVTNINSNNNSNNKNPIRADYQVKSDNYRDAGNNINNNTYNASNLNNNYFSKENLSDINSDLNDEINTNNPKKDITNTGIINTQHNTNSFAAAATNYMELKNNINTTTYKNTQKSHMSSSKENNANSNKNLVLVNNFYHNNTMTNISSGNNNINNTNANVNINAISNLNINDENFFLVIEKKIESIISVLVTSEKNSTTLVNNTANNKNESFISFTNNINKVVLKKEFYDILDKLKRKNAALKEEVEKMNVSKEEIKKQKESKKILNIK